MSYVNSASSYSQNNVTIVNCGYANSSLRELEENLTGLINELSKKEEHDKDFSNKDLSM